MDKNFYITTPIYYPSGKPHMGHAYSSIIADFFARFKSIDDYNVHFLTGTDEHGLKIQRSAEKAGKNPKEFCDQISQTFKDLSKTLNLSNTDFIRTTEDRHKKTVQHLWSLLEKNDDIYLSNYSGWYSVSDEAFYNEDEIEEIDGKKIAKSSKSTVEWIEEESYFFRLSKWQKPLLEFYENNPDFILPESRKNEVISFVKSGLKDLSVSRKTFTWGIPVPSNDKHIIYVWLDALTNYLSALNYPDTNNELFKKFWPASIHLIGKDILRFHAVYWPAFLLAAKIELPKKVYGHGWILSGEEKMSKSKGNILDPLKIIEEYGLDPLRYYLIKEVSFGNDGNISQDRLEDCINSDLANNYGNLCQRVTAFAMKNCDGKIPAKIDFQPDDLKILNKFQENLDTIRSKINEQNINFYIDFIVNSLFEANKYFNDQEPWKKKDNLIRLNTIVYTTLEIVRKISFLLYPIIPETSLKALKIFNLSEKDIKLETISNNEFIIKGNMINKIDILIKKIEKEMIDSHCHLDHEPLLSDLSNVLKRSKDVGIKKLLTISTSFESFSRIKDIVNKDEIIYGTVGIHPHESDTNTITKNEIVKSLKENPKIIGIGETGLDYYYNNSDKEKQITSFKTHIEAAIECDVPIIVHSRNAEDDTFKILNEYKEHNPKILMHCFTGSKKFSEKLLTLNSYFSASGIITFKNSVDLQETFRSLPIDKILIETDSPYLAPVPNRGKKNEPSFIDFTANKLSEIKEISKLELIDKTTDNFNRLFFQ